MLSENELRSRALANVAGAVRALLRGEYDFTGGQAESNWDPILKRYTYAAPVTVWRNMEPIRITVSESGEATSFADPNRVRGAKYERLPDADILRICRRAAIVGPAAAVELERPGPEGTLEAILAEPFPGTPRRTRVLINPTTRQLAAFEAQR